MIVPAHQYVHQAAALLSKGEVVVFPTETVYGLGADATQDEAIAKIYAIKDRPSFNPLIFHVKNVEEAQQWGIFNEMALKLAHTFWPGPLTLVMKKLPGTHASLLATAGLDTIALRVPRHPIIQEMLGLLGRPIVAPSANPSGFLSSTTAHHVEKNMGQKVSLILDGGPTETGLESTIIDVSTETPVILRYGALSVNEIEKTVGSGLTKKDQVEMIRAPGQLRSHYAPHLPLRLNATECLPDEAFLGFGSVSYSDWNLSPTGNLIEAATHFFAYLHALDQPHLYKGIAVAPIPMEGLGLAINDRLERGAV